LSTTQKYTHEIKNKPLDAFLVGSLVSLRKLPDLLFPGIFVSRPRAINTRLREVLLRS
jgi:hypothetical protein